MLYLRLGPVMITTPRTQILRNFLNSTCRAETLLCDYTTHLVLFECSCEMLSWLEKRVVGKSPRKRTHPDVSRFMWRRFGRPRGLPEISQNFANVNHGGVNERAGQPHVSSDRGSLPHSRYSTFRDTKTNPIREYVCHMHRTL